MPVQLPTMTHVWLEIARLIRDEEPCGPYICNLANLLRRQRRITNEQRDSIMWAVTKERERQDAGLVLWADAAGEEELVLRIQFCTEQIRRLRRRAQRELDA